jgi:hypothetical protein
MRNCTEEDAAETPLTLTDDQQSAQPDADAETENNTSRESQDHDSDERMRRAVKYLHENKSINEFSLTESRFNPSNLPSSFLPSETCCHYCKCGLAAPKLATRRV